MTDPQTPQTNAAAEAAPRPVAAGPGQPAKSVKQTVRLAMQWLTHHPTGRKISAGSVAVIVFLFIFTVPAALRRTEPGTKGPGGSTAEFADDDLADDGADDFAGLAIPTDLTTPIDLLVDNALAEMKKKTATTPPPKREAAPAPSPPRRAPRPRFVTSAQATAAPPWLQPLSPTFAIPEHLSLRHESAVDPDALASLKWSDLAPDQQEWFRGRAMFELEVMMRALALLARTPVVVARNQVGREAGFLVQFEIRSLMRAYQLLTQPTPPEGTPGFIQRSLRRAHGRFADLGYVAPDFSEGLPAK